LSLIDAGKVARNRPTLTLSLLATIVARRRDKPDHDGSTQRMKDAADEQRQLRGRVPKYVCASSEHHPAELASRLV